MLNNHVLSIDHKIVYLSRLLRESFRQELRQNGLFVGQHDLLMRIRSCPGITASAIAKELDLSLATVSVSIKRLEKSGFIEKKADEKDNRTYRLYLSRNGQDVQEKIYETQTKKQSVLTNGMTPQQKQELSELLGIMIENLGGNNINDLEQLIHPMCKTTKEAFKEEDNI